MVRKLSPFLVFLLAGELVASTPEAVEITVRAINGKTGQPLVRYLIRLDGVDAMYPEANVHRLAIARTGREGTALFKLQQPLPTALFIETEEAHFRRSGMVSCGRPQFSTEEVLRSGVVGHNGCDPQHRVRQRFSARPGEVVVFSRKKTFWESFPG